MADLDSFASGVCHSHHQRYRRPARVRHSRQFEEFLVREAGRLSTTTSEIFTLLDSHTADQILAASSLAALQAEPVGSH